MAQVIRDSKCRRPADSSIPLRLIVKGSAVNRRSTLRAFTRRRYHFVNLFSHGPSAASRLARYSAHMHPLNEPDPLNAFCRHTAVRVPGALAGPLAGLQCGIKDIYAIQGSRTGFGHPQWLAAQAPATHTAHAVQRLLDAGATVIGKTQTDELTYSLTGENYHYGTPVNVNAVGRIPGGSSSGSAAATAGGLVDFALGSDTGGSVRLPASFCGIFGIRPTHGRISLEGACALAPSMDTCGWFARTAPLLEKIGLVLLDSPAHPGPPLQRALLATDAFALADLPSREALAQVLPRVTRSLGPVQEITLSTTDLTQWREVFRHLQGAEVWATHGAWITQVQPVFGPGVRERFQWAAQLKEVDMAPLRAQRHAIAAHLDALLGTDTVLIIPSASGIAPRRDSPAAELDEFRLRSLNLLCLAGLAGLPQISLPLAWVDGCPVGLSLVGPRHADEQLLALASAFCAVP